MRRILLATMTILTLLLAPLALADGGHGRDAAKASAHPEPARNESENDTEADHAPVNHTEERAEAVAFHARLAALRDSFRENVSALIEGCRAPASSDMGHHNNTTLEQHRSWAHCIANGFEALKIQFHAEKKELRAERRAEREADKASS